MVFILLNGLELRSYLKTFELYIYLGNTLNLIQQSCLLYSPSPLINIRCLHSLLRLFLEIGNEGRRGWFPRNFNFC